MTDRIGAHEPRPEFSAALEREIARTLRRETPAGRPSAGAPRLRVAFLVLAALVLGGAVGMVSGQVQDAQRRDALLEALRAEAQLAQVRVQMARASYQEARARFEVGALSSASLAAAAAEAREMEARLGRLQLDLEEIRASAQPPRDELTAPLVSGRDFVSERLHLELAAAQQRLKSAEDALAEIERRRRLGTAAELTQIEAQNDLARARTAMELLAQRLDLRTQFVEQRLSAEQVMAQAHRQELLQEYQLARRLHEAAEQRHAGLVRLRETGLATQLEVMRAEVEVMERALELQRAQRQMQLLEAARRDSPRR